jgi:hypothetical protein
MTIPATKRRASVARATARGPEKDAASGSGRASGALDLGRAAARKLIGRLPRTMRATRAGAHGTTSALQTLPDSTLRGLAASSVGLGAGFYLAGAPRLAIAAGIAPALIMGAAIVLRPTKPNVPVAADR